MFAGWLGATLAACGADDEGSGGPGDYAGGSDVGGDGAGAGDTAQSSGSGSGNAGSSGSQSGAGASGGAGVGTGGAGGGAVQDCIDQCALDHADGQETFVVYASCLYCGECAKDCATEAYGLCRGQLPTGDACDNRGDCTLCVDCANGSACSDEAQACQSQPDCLEYANCIAACETY